MMRTPICNLILLIVMLLTSCQQEIKKEAEKSTSGMPQVPTLDIILAERILDLPKGCIVQEYPNKLGQTLGSSGDLKTPKELRPIFYGCFDWHSSVHGYWSIIKILKDFPDLDSNGQVRNTLSEHITVEHVATELAFFKDENNSNFERTYGWAWLFTLQKELTDWTEDHQAQQWADMLQPLASELVRKYEEYLPKLTFPIRTGTHDNTAFGLSLSLDYARSTGDKEFESLIVTHAKRLYESDKGCPIHYEPSGHDFLSPCLEEAYLMSKIMPEAEFSGWLEDFLPQLMDENLQLDPAKVTDRSDGHLVHLDGLNFSRSTCLSGIANKLGGRDYLKTLAAKHLSYSLDNIQSEDDYMGSHWLGTFALYALNQINQ